MAFPVAVTAVVLGAVAYACTPAATLVVRPARAEAGAVFQVSGELFDPTGQAVKIFWVGGSGQELLATAPVDGNGRFPAQDLRVPAGAPQGFYIVRATQQYTNASYKVAFWIQNASFEVIVPGAPATQPPAQPVATTVPEPAPAAGPAPGPVET
ncbi:MAG: hypothetical protein ACRD0F_03760, partial [Acidimicrobiales bacterium]